MKQARLEAHLSLAQVGKGQVTAPAIYLIETGRTRPSLPTLEHIARRTGKPIEYFLADPGGATNEDELGLVELESLVVENRFADALALGERLLHHGTSAHRLGRIRYYVAFSLLNLRRPAEAAPLLKDARAHFEAADDRLMLAECLGSEAVLLNLTEKPGAVELAEQAVAICRSIKPVPRGTEARLLTVLGNAHAANREWDRAIAAYEAAVDYSGVATDLRRLAVMYGGVANAYREAGQLEQAARFATRAITLFEVLRDQRNLAVSENNLGLILMSKGDRDRGGEHLDRSLELHDEVDLELGRAHVLLSLSDLNLEEGNVARAREFAHQALDLAERLEERPNVAEAHIRLGLAADRDGDAAGADNEFQHAISELTAIGGEERLLKCHGLYAEVLERRGEMDKAYAHMKKAFAASRPGMLHERDDDQETASLA
ncbi:MAG TPA: tetratricopeptide repeat protein [Candidatus Dormibacteraeota bacterium]|nr:tetratricopeptide repeat protein [Candidatus Dormibacteraeota bacterium]